MRKPQLTLPQAITDRLPDAVSQRLPGAVSTNRRITGKRVVVGGGILAVLAAIATAGASAARKRYVTGEAKITDMVVLDKGAVVVLDNGTAFWASPETHRVLDTYTGDGASAMPYKIDKFRRHTASGLATGTVNTDN
jgi:hypothetical protein